MNNFLRSSIPFFKGLAFAVILFILSLGGHAATRTATISGNRNNTAITDVAGNAISGGLTGDVYNIDNTTPAPPTLLALAAGSDSGTPNDNITNVTTPTITGTADAGSIVTLYDTDGSTSLGSATATGGSFSITTTTLSEGAHNITAKAADGVGNISNASSVLAVTINTVIPHVILSPVAAVEETSTSFTINYSDVTGSPNLYSVVTASTNIMPGFSPLSNFSLNTPNPVSVPIPGTTAGTYDFIFNVRNQASGNQSADIPFSVTVNTPPASPTITLTGTLTAFNSCNGSPSADQSFKVSGTNLTADVIITAPAGYEISKTSGSGYNSQLTLTESAGIVSLQDIFVHIIASASGSPAGDITITSTGVADQAETISGTVNDLPVITLGAITPVNTSATTFSIPYSGLSGGNFIYYISTGATAMAGFSNVNDFALNPSPISVNIPVNTLAGTYDFNLTIVNTATNCTSAAIPFTVRVNPAIPAPTLSYNSTQTYTAGTVITPLAPTASGVDVPGYTAPGLVTNGFLAPLGIAADTLGNVYVADKGNNLVKKINVNAGTTVNIGSGFNTPSGVAVDAAGNIYVADSGNGLVKKIPADNSGIVNIGTGFNSPVGVAVDAAGNVYVADAGNASVYKVPVSGPQVTMDADFDDLTGIAVDQHGNVYVSDGSASSVYRIAAKGGGAIDIGFVFNFPTNVAVDAAGNLYVADGYGKLVYKVEGGRGNPVNTGFTYQFPSGVAADPSGNLFVADASLNVLYKVTPSGGYSLKTALPAGLRFNDTTGTISGKPSAATAAANYTVIAYNAGGSTSASFSIEVDNPPAPTLSYSSPQTYTAGTAVSPLVPTATGVGTPGYNSTPITLAAGFNQPGGTAVDAAGNVYFADSGNNKVMMLPVGGGAAVELGSGFAFPTGVALDAAGNIYVADQGNGLVKKMPPGGGTPVSIGTGFSGPGSVAVDAAGNVYVADSSDGGVYKICAGSGNTVQLGGDFVELTGIAVDGKENLYFTDGGDHAVYKVALAGGVPFNIGCYFNFPSGIAVDNSGNVYVTDKTDNTLYRITKGGNKQVPIGTGFNAPSGVAVDAMGNVYIGDTGNNAIEKLIPAGGYFISDVLPAGLKFSGTTGIISGTPTAVSAAKDYKITACSYGGSASATVNITVVLPPPPTLSYSGPVVYPVNVAITPLIPTASGVSAPGYSNTLAVIDTGFNFPIGLGLDHAGNIYVANSGNDTLYKIPAGGGVRTSVGTGFTAPVGVAFDAAGNIYVADAGNSMVKKIPFGGGAPVEIGSGFNYPAGIAADAAGNVYVADQGNQKIYKIAAGNGPVTTLTSAIVGPSGIAVDVAGNIYITDQSTGSLFKLAKGSNTPVSMGYTFNAPTGVTIDGAGNLYVADASVGQVKEIPAGGGALVTIGGFIIPYGVAADGSGNLYVSDVGSNSVYKVKPGGGYYIDPVLPAGLSFNSTTGAISGTPTVPSPATDYTVTAYNFGGSISAIVNIKILSTDATLSALSTSAGAFNPAFNPATTTGYAVTVPYPTATTTVTALTTDINATIQVRLNGGGYSPLSSGTVSGDFVLNAGSNSIDVQVTAQDGSTIKTYTINVIRTAPSSNVLLTYLAINPQTALIPASGPDYKDYIATVGNSVSSLTVIPTSPDVTNTISVNNVLVASGTPSGSIPLNVGSNTIVVIATAQDGVTKRTYGMKITRLGPALLTNLSISPKTTLHTVQGPDYKDYTALVANSVSSVTVTPVGLDAGNTITVNNVVVPSGTASPSIPLNIGDNTITTVVTDGVTTNTYSIKLTRLAPAVLFNLSITPPIHLNQVTGPDYKDYTATTGNSVSSVTITPTDLEVTATITVNNVVVPSGMASPSIPLNVGDNTITTVVTDGLNTNTYKIVITRLAPAVLTNLTINPKLTLRTVSGADYKDYTATAGNSVSSITVTPTAADATASITVNNVAVASGTASGSIPLNVGDNTITTVVTEGLNTNTYSMTITRLAPALLTNLTVSPRIVLTTVSGSDYKDYTSTVNNSVSSVMITPTAADGSAMITVNNVAVVSGTASDPITLNVGANTITTSITDGVTTNTYSINITRQAPVGLVSLYDEKQTAPVTVNEVVVHQNVSPNGDGKSDYLQIDGISAYPDNTLQIMSRNGTLVYEIKGYDNTSKVFDGHSNTNGKLQQAGTYFYSLEYKDGNDTKHKTGFLVLKY